MDLSHTSLSEIFGLRVDGARAVRAKYPNGSPELSDPDAADAILAGLPPAASGPSAAPAIAEGRPSGILP